MIRKFGDITLVSETHKRTRQTAHLITFGDGAQLRLLPGSESGRKRATVARDALERTEPLRKALSGDSAALVKTYVVGELSLAGLEWEWVNDLREVTFDEWLDEWFELFGAEDVAFARKSLLGDMADDGWVVVRKGEE